MNKQLRHVPVFALVLLAVLIGATTYWQTWAKADLAARKGNSVSLIERLTVDRGKILAADGTVLANNRKSRKHGLTLFTREGRYDVPGLPRPEVDATGAGDDGALSSRSTTT